MPGTTSDVVVVAAAEARIIVVAAEPFEADNSLAEQPTDSILPIAVRPTDCNNWVAQNTPAPESSADDSSSAGVAADAVADAAAGDVGQEQEQAMADDRQEEPPGERGIKKGKEKERGEKGQGTYCHSWLGRRSRMAESRGWSRGRRAQG